MKTNEAKDLLAMMGAATSGAGLDATKQAFWEEQLSHLDAEQATQAVLLGIRAWKFFPSWSDFLQIYAGLSKLGESERETERIVDLASRRPVKEIPFWVKRWACARMLYARFDKERDERRFAEQVEFSDPTAEAMPDDAWVNEAKTISSAEAWSSVVGMAT